MVYGTTSVSLSITTTLSPLFSSLSQGFHVLVSQALSQTLICNSLCPPSFSKRACYCLQLIILLCPKASRAVNNHTSFSTLSSSSSCLTWASASSWASVARWSANSRDQPTVAAICFPSLLQCTVCGSSNTLNQPAFLGYPCSHATVHRHLTMHHPCPQRGQWPTQDFPYGCLFPKTHFFHLWLACQLLVCNSWEFPGWYSKLAPI